METQPVIVSNPLHVPPFYNISWAEWWKAAGPITISADTVHTCGLAWRETQNADYAAHVDAILNDWATQCKTISPNDDTPLSLSENILGFVWADVLIGQWTGRNINNVHVFLDWLGGPVLTVCKTILGRPNNWACWGNTACLAIAKHLGQDFSQYQANFLAQCQTMIAPDGSMPQEMKRTGAQIWYTYYALVALTVAARLLDVRPLSIANAINYLAGMVANQNGTTGFVPGPEKNPAQPWPYDLFAAAGEMYSNDNWRALAAPYAPIQYLSHHTGWNYPTLMCQTGY